MMQPSPHPAVAADGGAVHALTALNVPPEPSRPTHHELPHRSDAAATEAMVLFAKGELPARDAVFDDADATAAALGDRVRGAAWWDATLGGMKLEGAVLTGARLRHANLSHANLVKATLAKASCTGIVLRGARLDEADFSGADLVGGCLAQADASETRFTEAFLEDADLTGARLRFADFTDAAMDGADLSGADLWGAKLQGCAAERARFRGARLDDAKGEKADLALADFSHATFRRANLRGANLRGAVLRDAVLDGASLAGANLTGAILPHVVLTGCDLRHARFAGAWLERTRMGAGQLGGAVGEEEAGEFEAARDAYIVLEQNFRSLGNTGDASWAFLRRRRMGKRLQAERARAALGRRDWAGGLRPGLRWLADAATEWVCDYGESLARVWRTFLTVLILFAAVYWVTGCLEVRGDATVRPGFRVVDYLLFSLDSMTTVGTSAVALQPNGQLGVLLSSVETVVGTVLLGLFGFVLGARMRNSA